MKKIDLGQTITILANLGVIAGIIFLAVELRQNTAATISAAELEVTNLQTEFHMRLAENPGLARLYYTGQCDPSVLTDNERVQYTYIVAGLFLFIEGVYKQYRRGFFPNDGWMPYEDLMAYMLDTQLVYEWWSPAAPCFGQTSND